jgi:CheY-like chemotaxis protein
MSTRESIRILVVEDELITAEAIAEILKDAGYGIAGIVSSGWQAVLNTAELKPDLVLLDIKLKGSVDGVMAAHKIQEQYNIPVVFLTALSDYATKQRIAHSKPYGYLVKPIKAEELVETIERALRYHKSDSEG